MRERSTWNREEVVKKAAISKKADPYTMNQDHPQPAADKYVTGDPSTFAEDVHEPNTWESEYANGQTKRDEIGLPEMRSDTFNHSEKTASEVMLKKADLCIAVARLMLSGKKTASESAVEDQAVALMSVPDRELIATHKRLAEDQDDDKPAFLKDKEDDKGQDKQAQEQQQQQAQAPVAQEQQQAQAPVAQQQQEQQQQQAQAPVAQQQDQQQQTQQAQAQVAQAQVAQQIQQLIQAGNYQQAQQQIQQLMQQQDQGQQAQQQTQQQMQQDQGQQAQGQQQDEQTLDQMLAADDCGPMAEADIEMAPSPMDVGMDDLGPEDEVLRTLFANDDDQEGQGQTQQKQATVRTASTRTVGTRPTAGVSKIGGTASQGAPADLSSLWATAPDVREIFGLK